MGVYFIEIYIKFESSIFFLEWEMCYGSCPTGSLVFATAVERSAVSGGPQSSTNQDKIQTTSTVLHVHKPPSRLTLPRFNHVRRARNRSRVIAIGRFGVPCCSSCMLQQPSWKARVLMRCVEISITAIQHGHETHPIWYIFSLENKCTRLFLLFP